MRRTGPGILLFLLSGALSCGGPEEGPAPAAPEAPVGWEVAVAADKEQIQVGEDLSVRVTVRHPPNAEFLIPTADLLPFELIERRDEEPSSLVESHIVLRVGAYRLPGDIAFPPIRVEYRDESGNARTIETKPIPIRLVTSLTPEVTDIHDIKGPVEDIPMPSSWSPLWWLLVALLAAILAYLLYRKLRRKRDEAIEAAPTTPPPPPDVEAERALRNLANQRLLEQGRRVEFFTSLPEIMKRYAGRRFDVPYLERTTTEILTDLRKAGLPREPFERLRGILIGADLVKFARIFLADQESQRMIPESFRFVDETRPRHEPSTAPPQAAAVEVGP